VQAFAEALRLAPLRESAGAPYRYEREVEEFLRRSPNVRRQGPDAPGRLQP
jgi:UDP-glucose 4-epimerase